MDWYPRLDSCDDLASLQAVCESCGECGLRESASRVVFGKGSPNAVVMLVGEAPGADEDRRGEPFVGKAGQLLDKILDAAGIERGDTYITNIVKCRPPMNRPPNVREIDACTPYLIRQIEIVAPKIIVCLGSLAARRLIHPDAKITLVRGRVFQKGPIKIVPTFHPAALLRDPDKKKPCWNDFRTVRVLYESAKKRNIALSAASG